LEWAQVHGDHEDRLYGTLRASVLEPLAAGRDLVINVDVQGVENLRRAARAEPVLARALTTVFIVVDPAELAARMRARAGDHAEEIARRLATAEAELRAAPGFDHRIHSRSRDEDFAALLALAVLVGGVLARQALTGLVLNALLSASGAADGSADGSATSLSMRSRTRSSASRLTVRPASRRAISAMSASSLRQICASQVNKAASPRKDSSRRTARHSVRCAASCDRSASPRVRDIAKR
jgi:hypothetical protein